MSGIRYEGKSISRHQKMGGCRSWPERSRTTSSATTTSRIRGWWMERLSTGPASRPGHRGREAVLTGIARHPRTPAFASELGRRRTLRQARARAAGKSSSAMGAKLIHRRARGQAACCHPQASVQEVSGFDGPSSGFGDLGTVPARRRTRMADPYCGHARLVHHESYTRGTSKKDPHRRPALYR